MKTKLTGLLFLLGSLAAANSADWIGMSKSPATVEVLNMKSQTLAQGEGKDAWSKIPPKLLENKATIFMPTGQTNGVADFTVTADGWLLVAVNYDYQGNSSGDWQKERWDEKKFKAKGWHLFSKNEAGGLLIKGDGKAQELLAKKVKKGDKERIRCNKYDPPFLILLGDK